MDYWQLDKFKTCASSAMATAIDQVIDLMKQAGVTVPESQPRNMKKLTDHIRVILSNLIYARHTDPAMYIAVLKGSSYNTADPAYQGFQFSSGNVNKVADFLHQHAFIEILTGYPGSDQWTQGQASKTRATDKLDTLHDVDHTSIYRDCTHKETVVVKGKKIDYILKDRTGRPILDKRGRKQKRKRRNIIKTPEIDIVRQMRRKLATINEVFQKANIDLDLDQHDLDELNRQLAKDPDKYIRPVDFTQKQLYRVFLDGSLDCHGRFYGPWHVNIPEEYREKILIDGMPVAELDYGYFHPSMLYCLEGLDIPPGDLYLLPDYPTDKPWRNFIKQILLIRINAKSDGGAIGALRKDWAKKFKKAKKQGKPIPKPPIPLEDPEIMGIIKRLRERHAPIQHYFDRPDIGNILMNYDSQIAEQVMLHYAKKGIPALPIHDSFVVPVDYADECWDVMLDAFQDVMAVEFSEPGAQAISIDGSYVQGVMNAMKRVRALDRSPEWDRLERDITIAIKADDEAPTDEFGPDGDYPFESDDLWPK